MSVGAVAGSSIDHVDTGQRVWNAAQASLGANGALGCWLADEALECWCAGGLRHMASKW